MKPLPLFAVTNLPTLNNLNTLNQAELPPTPRRIAIHSGKTDKTSIRPFMLKKYLNFLSAAKILSTKSRLKNKIINLSNDKNIWR